MALATRHIAVNDTDITRTEIHNPRLVLIGRVVWGLVFLFSLTVVLLNTPYFFNTVRTLPSSTASFFLRSLAQHQETWYSGLTLAGLSPEIPALYLSVISRMADFTFILVGALVFYYRSTNWMAMWLSLACIMFAMVDTNSYWVLETLPGGTWLLMLVVPAMATVMISLLYVMPDGHFVPRQARWLAGIYLVCDVFRFHQQIERSDLFLKLPYIVWLLPVLLFLAGGVGGQIYRYRHASSVYRHQLKWFVFGVAMLLLAWILFAMGTTLSASIARAWGPAGFVVYQLILGSFLPFGATNFGVCLGLAVTRYRLYDINFVINRSLVYGAVTVLMALVFLGGGLALQNLLGQQQSGLAFAISIFGAALLFNPARHRVQHVIDRRFYGFRFDLYELKRAGQLPVIATPGALTGKTTGKYVILGVIGRGGMGEVYQGQCASGTVAIKILPVDLALQEDFRKRFEREARVLATFDHPNIVKFHEFGESDGLYYIVLEYIQGHALSHIIERRGAIPIAEVRPYMRDFAAALDYAHQKGLIHRDIKPSNIMIRPKADGAGDEAILMDFGVAKIQDARTQLTGTGAVGTIDYMSPEQIMASGDVDHRTDIYALGVVMYEMLTGQRPFKGSPGQVLFAHLQQPPPDPRQLQPDIPEQVALAVMRAMAKSPEDRFQSVLDFVAAMMA